MRLLDRLGSELRIDGEAVVHRGDLDLAGGQVLDRMIGAVMALMHLLRRRRRARCRASGGRGRCRTAGTSAAITLADGRHGIFAGRGGIAGTVREEDAVRLVREDLLAGRRRRQHGHGAAGFSQQAQDVALDAVVDGDDLGAAAPPAGRSRSAPDPRRLVPAGSDWPVVTSGARSMPTEPRPGRGLRRRERGAVEVGRPSHAR